MESEEKSGSGVASLALASAYVAKSIFNAEDNGLVTNVDAKDEDDSAPTYCFMASGAKGKVSSRKSKASDAIAGDLKNLVGAR